MTSPWNPRSINWDWEAQFADATDVGENATTEGYRIRPFYYYALPVSSLAMYKRVTEMLTTFYHGTRQQQLNIVAGIIAVPVNDVAKWVGSPVEFIYSYVGSGGPGGRHPATGDTDDYTRRKQWYLQRVHQLNDSTFAHALYDLVGGDEGLFLMCWVLMLDDCHRRIFSKHIDFTTPALPGVIPAFVPSTSSTSQLAPPQPPAAPVAPVASSESSSSNYDRIMSDLNHDMKMIEVTDGADGTAAKKKAKKKKKKKSQSSPSPSASPSPAPHDEGSSSSSTVTAAATVADAAATTKEDDEESYDDTAVDEPGYIDEDDYEMFAYNEVDDSDAFQSLLSTLMDLFPMVPRSELSLYIKTSDDIERLIEYLCVESESHSLRADLAAEAEEAPVAKVYDDAVIQLKEVFPSIDVEALEQAYEQHHKDITATTDFLLTHDANDLNFTMPSQRSKPQDADTIAELLGVSPDIARAYLNSKGNQSIVDAIIEIILWHKPTPESPPASSASSSASSSSQRTSLGRVQRGGAANKPRQRAPQYKYRPQSSEATELKEWYNSNPQFRAGFPLKFMVQALIYFSGDVQRVVSLAAELVSMNMADKFTDRYNVVSKRKRPAELTAQERLESAASADYVAPDPQMRTLGNTFADAVAVKKPQDPAKTWQAVSTHRKSMVEQFASIKFASAEPLEAKAAQLLSRFKQGADLDLHGLRLADAVKVTRDALAIWWNNEMHQREVDGQLHKFGSRAEFAGPMKVITGRGLHSEGGVSVIRKAIYSMLKMGGYTFDTQVGAFVVTGKRIRGA